MDKKEAISDRLAKNLPTKHKKLDQVYIDKKDIKDDYEFSRQTLKDLIKTKELTENIEEVLVPMHEVTEVKRGKRVQRKKNIFQVMYS